MAQLSEVARATPTAQMTLRAHKPAPARVELQFRTARYRAAWAAAWLIGCWGAIPLLVWVPPHYPWVALAFIAGWYMAYREWRGRYRVTSFAGICPRCARPLSLGADKLIDLPHKLTCFTCHFEPRLEVRFPAVRGDNVPPPLEHQLPDCIGMWERRWLADAPFVYCEICHAGCVETPEVRAIADAENDRADLLKRLSDEGWPMI
jgi:hypothetical protein